jgi:D-arginine dehydrogenase
MDTADIVIVGGGIAGASLAYFLTREGCRNVVLLEREATPGYHSSGRSAAIYLEWDEDPVIQTLQLLSREFFFTPPEDFSDVPIFQRTGVLDIVSPEDLALLEQPLTQCQAAGIPTERWSPQEACAQIPLLKEEHVGGGIFFPNCGNIAIHELLSGYLQHARAAGAQVRTGTTVTGLDCTAGRISGVRTTQGTIHTRCVVNAAGAWADQLYTMAGGTPLGITPLRRTIIVPTPPSWYQPSPWPFVMDKSHHFYGKPEGRSIIASPMDEDPVEPCDARPDALRVAEIADRLERWTRFPVPGIEHKWAGLRSFAPDRRPVVGEDPIIAGFFWLAGQGGVGILTSPAMGRIAAALLMHGDTDLLDKAALSPARFATPDRREAYAEKEPPVGKESHGHR